MTVEELLKLFGRIGTVHVAESMRQEFKAKLDELGVKYLEKWDGAAQKYVYLEREDKLI